MHLPKTVDDGLTRLARRDIENSCMAALEFNRLATHIFWGETGPSASSVGRNLIGMTMRDIDTLVEADHAEPRKCTCWRFKDGSWLTLDGNARGPEWAGVLSRLIVHAHDPHTYWERHVAPEVEKEMAWDDDNLSSIFRTQEEADTDLLRASVGIVRPLTRWQAEDAGYEVESIQKR